MDITIWITLNFHILRWCHGAEKMALVLQWTQVWFLAFLFRWHKTFCNFIYRESSILFGLHWYLYSGAHSKTHPAHTHTHSIFFKYNLSFSLVFNYLGMFKKQLFAHIQQKSILQTYCPTLHILHYRQQSRLLILDVFTNFTTSSWHILPCRSLQQHVGYHVVSHH